MKSKSIVLIGMFLCALIVGAQNETFNVTPKFPVPGEEVVFNYNSEETILKNKSNITGEVYLFVENHWEAYDLNIKKLATNSWQAAFNLPEKTALMTCVFKADTLVDSGNKLTYSWLVDKQPLSRFAWGMLRSGDFTEFTPQIVDSTALIDREVTMMWINNEMQFHPESRLNVFYEGLKLRQLMQPGDPVEQRIKEELKFLLEQNLNVSQQWKLQNTVSLLPFEKYKGFRDSLETVVLSKYPKGVLARDKEIFRMFRLQGEERNQALMQFKTNFPESEFEYIYTETEGLYLDKVIKSVAYQEIVDHGTFNYIFNNIKTFSAANTLDLGWHLVTIPYDREAMPLDSIKGFADKIIPELERHELLVPKEFKGQLTPSQWKQEFEKRASGEYLTYANILFKTGDFIKSRSYVEKIKHVFGFTNAEFNDLNVGLLIQEGKTDDAIDFIEICVKENSVTPEMLEILKESYNKQNYSIPFDDYLANLKTTGEAYAVHKSKLLSELINEPIEGFNLESNKGGKVKLSKQKGKIVIIDMWATWCAPCKKAMPGMQMVANKYAQDNNVKFYFLDTQEFDKNYKEKVNSFLDEKGYDFEVLFDAKNPETGKLDDTYSKYGKAFKFSGIPQKMIIDGNGKLRWRSTGYMGSPSELADEISIIIEYLKNEN